MPCSISVGVSGRAGVRFSPVAPIGRTLLARKCGLTDVVLPMARSGAPARVAGLRGRPALQGGRVGLLSRVMVRAVGLISLAWMMRATGSVEPPGGKGTMILIGPLGQSPCALAMAGAASTAAALPTSTERRRRAVIFPPLNALLAIRPI